MIKLVSLVFAIICTVTTIAYFDTSYMEAFLIGISYGAISQM